MKEYIIVNSGYMPVTTQFIPITLLCIQLMDLVGLDHFELLQKMLEHRESIVASTLENPALLLHGGRWS